MNQPIEFIPSVPPVSTDPIIERPTCINDLRKRPKFVAPLKITSETKLVDVLSQYSFDRLEPCGLSTCKQWHLHGYLVVTASGAETNIGHKCGKREFGIDFVMADARWRRAEDRRVTLGRMLELQSEAPRIKEQIQELVNRKHGVRWVYSLRDAVRGLVGRAAFEHLKLRSVRNEYAVIHVREIRETESGAPMGRSGRGRQQVRYVNERLGQLAPMEWTRWDFPGVLLRGVRDEFQVLAALSPAQMETKELKKRLKRVEGWEHAIRAAETMLTQAVQFLDRENLRIVDLALEEQRRAAGGPQVESLREWAASDEYTTLLRGTYRDGQVLGG